MNSRISTGLGAMVQRLIHPIRTCPHFVWIVLVIGLGLRLAWVFAWENEQSMGDYLWYNVMAKRLAAGQGYVLPNGNPTAFWPMGYPLSLSVLYRSFGPHELAGKLANVLYSMGILTGTYLLGRKLFSETTARLALLFLSFSPNQIGYNSLLATEPLFTMLFVASLVVVFAHAQRPVVGLMLGVLCGISSYVKPVTLGLFPLFFLCLWVLRRDWKQAALQTAIAIGITVLFLSPWIVRNRIVFGKWLLTNEAGIVLLVGANPEATGQYHRAAIIHEILPKMQEGGEAEYKWNREAQKLAIQYIREHPLQWIQAGCKKLFHMYKHDVDGVRHTLLGVTPRVSNLLWATLIRIGHLYYALLMALVLGYVVLSARRKPLLWPPNLGWLFVFFFSAVCFTFHGLPRYHYPLMPIFCVWAAHAAAVLLGGDPAEARGEKVLGR